MTTITWSAPADEWKSLCVNELRLEAVPNAVKLGNCKVCVAPQIVVKTPVTGCFSCRQIPARLNLYLDQAMTGGAEDIQERFQIQYPTESLVDGVTGTWTTTHTKKWFIAPVPGDSRFALDVLPTSYGTSLPITDSRCFFVWGRLVHYLRYTLAARGAPTQTVQWRRPVTGILQEQREWPSGPTTVGPDEAVARWTVTGRTAAQQVIGLTSLVGGLDHPDAVVARAAIDAANLTMPTTVQGEHVVSGYAWQLQVGDGWNPLILNPPRWRPSRRFTLTLHGACMARVSAKVSPGIGGYVSGGWNLTADQVDMTGVRPNTYPRDPFVPPRAPFSQWINPTFPASYFGPPRPGQPPLPIELPIRYGAPSTLMTVHQEVEHLPGIERGDYRLVFSDIVDFDFLPHQNRYSHPFIGKDRPVDEVYTGRSTRELGRWVGEAACDQNSPIRLTGGPTYPHRYGGPMNIPSQVYLDIGNPP